MRFPLFVLAIAACGSGQKPMPIAKPVAVAPVAATPVAVAPALVAPELRLPPLAKPLRNDVELTIDPATEDFTGSIVTELRILAPTTVIWLNALEITVDTATLTVDGKLLVATASSPAKGYLALVFTQPLAPGKATLAIKYRGKMHKDDGDGIYTAQEAGDWYAFTQFEATDARQAFPTFDEPSYKVPWQVTIHAKTGLVALSNTPVERTTAEANGMTATRFAVTRPLPSYLVAFAVGPFEAVDAGKTRGGVPIRIIVPKGRTADVAYPVEATRPLLDLLEDYFGTPYPFPKLDMVAVSIFNAGAMENPGLITFRQEIVVTKPAEMTAGKQQRYAIVAAHEMAHQWFGDDVTLAWWDDTWLNESFASWMETKIVAQWKPAWDLDVDMVGGKSRAMGSDSLESARAIRQPIDSANDISGAFDGITYGKGEAVLRMVERSIGADKFQKGVRAYLGKHAGGNATYTDFVTAISAAAGKDLEPLFGAFVKQSGVPLVSVELACKGKPTLALAQRRFVPIGSEIDPKRTWPVPVCVRWGAGGKTGRDCTTLDGETGSLALSAPSCPDWVLPNEGELGYYRWVPKGDLMARLLSHIKMLTMPERVGVLGDVEALITSGDLQSGVALGLVADQAKDKSRHIVGASIGIVAGIDNMVPDNLRPNYERFIRKIYLGRAREVGWKAAVGEGTDIKELRPELLALVAGDGKDPELIAQATALAWKWLEDHKTVDPEMVRTVLQVAARYGDQKLFDRLHADAKAVSRDERARYLSAMGAFTNPKIAAQAMALVLTDEFDLREGIGLINFQDPRTRVMAFDFVKTHFDEIAAKLPPMFRPYMAYMVVPVCDTDRKAELEAFLKPRIEKLDGGPRALTQALEQLSLCSAGRKAQSPGVVAFLKKQ